MQLQRVYVWASSASDMEAAASAAGAHGVEYYAYGTAVVGYIDLPSFTIRQTLRNDSRVNLIPNRHSQGNNITPHATGLGIQNAKTARDIFSAVFSATNADAFDPDL